MSDLGLEIGRQIDDIDGPEGTFLWTNPTSDAKSFGDKGDFGLWSDFDTKFASADNGARLFTFLTAFLSRHD